MIEQELEQPEVWCVTCRIWVKPSAELILSYSLINVDLGLDGTLGFDDVYSVFVDYTHLTCGSVVRFSLHPTWNEATFSYEPDSNPFVELFVVGYDTAYDYVSNLPDNENWAKTADSLRKSLSAAWAKVKATYESI